jgi:hypothetical protein
MPRNLVCATIVLQVLLCGSAIACEGQVGKVNYEDTFTDDTGGWDFTPSAATVKPPDFVFAMSSKFSNLSSQVLTFHATDADYCAEVIVPKSLAPDNKYGFAIQFWAVDYSNYWMVMLSSDGSIGLYSRTNGVWQTIANIPNAPGLKARTRRRERAARHNHRGQNQHLPQRPAGESDPGASPGWELTFWHV